MRNGTPSTSTGSVASNGPMQKGDEVGRHLHGVGEHEFAPPAVQRLFVDDRPVGDGELAFRHDQGDAEDGFEFRLVKAGKGAARIGGFKLRRGDDALVAAVILEDGAIKAVQFVI